MNRDGKPKPIQPPDKTLQDRIDPRGWEDKQQGDGLYTKRKI